MTQEFDQVNLPGPSGWFTFLYYFSTTILVVAVLGSLGIHLPWGAEGLYQYGLVLATLAGLLGVAFNRTTRCEITFKKKVKFQKGVEQLLAELGYELDEAAMARQVDEGPDFVIYQKTGVSKFLAGRVFLVWGPKSVQIMSRAANVSQLRRRLDS